MTETTTRLTPAAARPISDPRRRMLQNIANRDFGGKMRHDYIRHIEKFAKFRASAQFLGSAPECAGYGDR